MVKSFNKEEFMHAPVEIVLQQEEILDNAYDIRPFPHEQTIMISVGGRDYDVRELIWSLQEHNRELNDLRAKVNSLTARVERLMGARY